jgi:hypothetical protein
MSTPLTPPPPITRHAAGSTIGVGDVVNLNYIVDPANWAQRILFQRIGDCPGCNAANLWSWIKLTWGEVYEPWLGPLTAPWVETYCCMQFVVRRETLRRLPLAFYENALRFLRREPDAVRLQLAENDKKVSQRRTAAGARATEHMGASADGLSADCLPMETPFTHRRTLQRAPTPTPPPPPTPPCALQVHEQVLEYTLRLAWSGWHNYTRLPTPEEERCRHVECPLDAARYFDDRLDAGNGTVVVAHPRTRGTYPCGQALPGAP